MCILLKLTRFLVVRLKSCTQHCLYFFGPVLNQQRVDESFIETLRTKYQPLSTTAVETVARLPGRLIVLNVHTSVYMYIYTIRSGIERNEME